MLIDFKNKIFTGAANRQSLFDCKIPESPKAVIIFVHGYKGYKDWGAWSLMEEYFVNEGYGFVKFNFSHNGGTVDNPIDFPDLDAFGRNMFSYELQELNLIINETKRIVEQECALKTNLVVIGHSRGGGVSILTAAENPNVSLLISMAGISNIGMRFPTDERLKEWEREGVFYVENSRTKQQMPHFYSFYEDFIKNKQRLDIQLAAESLQIPFMQVHGDMDLTVSISEGQNIARWTDTELCIIKGAGHTFGAKQPWELSTLPEDLLTALIRITEFIENQKEKKINFNII